MIDHAEVAEERGDTSENICILDIYNKNSKSLNKIAGLNKLSAKSLNKLADLNKLLAKSLNKLASLNKLSAKSLNKLADLNKLLAKSLNKPSNLNKLFRRIAAIGRDGQIMTCSICGSDTHFRAQCTQGAAQGATTSSHAVWGGFTGQITGGPLGDLLGMSAPAAVQSSWFISESTADAAAVDAALPWPTLGHRSADDQHNPYIATPAPAPPVGVPQVLDSPLWMNDSTMVWSPSASTESWDQINATIQERLNLISAAAETGATGPIRPLESNSGGAAQIPLLSSFSQLESIHLQAGMHRGADPVTSSMEEPPWTSLGGAGPQQRRMFTEDLAADQLPASFMSYSRAMTAYQAENLEHVRVSRAREQQARARRAGLRRQAEPANAPLPAHDPDTDTCGICMDEFMVGERVSKLRCSHRYHTHCLDSWCAHSIASLADAADGTPPPNATCPHCRREVELDALEEVGIDATADPAPTLGPPPTAMDADSDGTSFGSATSLAVAAFPWWPVDTKDRSFVYHQNTQLRNGRLSFIVDPGAWTNLIGKKLARSMAQAALDAGHKPSQDPLDQPLEVAGVGNGSQ